jgi:hypothetical protein
LLLDAIVFLSSLSLPLSDLVRSFFVQVRGERLQQKK